MMPASRIQSAASVRAAIMMPMAALATSCCDGFDPIGSGLFGFEMSKSHASACSASVATTDDVVFIRASSKRQVDGEEHAAAGRERRHIDVPGDGLVPEIRYLGIHAAKIGNANQVAARQRDPRVGHGRTEQAP